MSHRTHEQSSDLTALSQPQRLPQQGDEQARQHAAAEPRLVPGLGAQARQLNRLAASRPAQLGPAMRQLQRAYGNRHVAGLLSLAREEEEETPLRRATVGEEEQEPVQRAPIGLAGGEVSPAIERSIEGARGGGQALDRGVRTQMEGAMGADFGGVRVHTGAEADRLNHQISAKAFTTGSDIFFRQGAYQPGSAGGRELLAHELTHVVQQGGGVRAKLTVGAAGDKYEDEADQVARAVMRQEQTAVQRQPGDPPSKDSSYTSYKVDSGPVETPAPALTETEEKAAPAKKSLIGASGRSYATTPLLDRYKGEESGKVWGTKVNYLDEGGRLPYEVFVKDGKLVDGAGNLLDTSGAASFHSGGGLAIFVMDETGRVFMSSVQIVGVFHHSSFLAGGPVAAAGEMRIKNGDLAEVTAKSGHYKPAIGLVQQVVAEFKARGVRTEIAVAKGF